VFATARLTIGPNETAAELEARLARLGAETLGNLLESLLTGQITPEIQSTDGVSYARRISKSDARIDWREPAVAIARRVRAFNPWPVAETVLDGNQLRCFASEALGTEPPAGGRVAGQILATDAEGIQVQTGAGVLRLLAIQAPGRQRVAALDFARGRTLPGKVLG
jgi:methionyl-tRNA formyltransferase